MMRNNYKKTIGIFLLTLFAIGVFVFSPNSATHGDKEALRLYEQRNQRLREFSTRNSPDGKKVAYYQNKFVDDIESIGDPDYASLLVEQNGQTAVVFQDNFRLSSFEWLTNDEIKIYKGCGSGCLLSYVVNVNTKDFQESVEKIFNPR